jgi:hypothetical protein
LLLHLVDDGLGALVTVGRELGGLAGKCFELLAQLDRLLHGRRLRASQLRQGAAVVDRLAGLEHPRLAPRRLIVPTSGADGARRVSRVASVSTGDPDRPDLRTYQASPGLPVLMLVMTPAPFHFRQ